MPTISKLNTPKKSPRKRAVYLDGSWAFNCSAGVAEKCGLVAGMTLSDEEVAKIKGMEVQQKVLDKALAILSKRLHSQAELVKKLTKADYSSEQIAGALETLTRLGYIDDVRFAKTKANAAAEYRKHGRRRAYVELVKAGVERETARRTSEEVYETKDSMGVARELARKKLPALRKLDKATANRRLMGMLLRRGFTFDEIKPVLDEVLGRSQVWEAVSPAPGEVVEAGAGEGGDVSVGPEKSVVEITEAGAVAGGEVGEPATETDTDETTPTGNWREALLSHHQRGKEKPKSKWRRR